MRARSEVGSMNETAIFVYGLVARARIVRMLPVSGARCHASGEWYVETGEHRMVRSAPRSGSGRAVVARDVRPDRSVRRAATGPLRALRARRESRFTASSHLLLRHPSPGSERRARSRGAFR